MVSVDWIISVLVGTLLIGSFVRCLRLRQMTTEERRDRLASLGSWWVLALLLSVCLAVGHVALIVLFALASCLAFFEFDCILCRQTVSFRRIVQRRRWVFYGLIVVHYLWLIDHQTGWIYLWLPVVGLPVCSWMAMSRGEVQGFVRETAGRYWALMICAFLLSFVTMADPISGAENPWNADRLGWIVFLVLLTQINDIAQAMVGKSLGKAGRFPLAPTLSPKKTWEGAGGGLVVTVIAAMLIAGPLGVYDKTSLAWKAGLWSSPLWVSAVAGALISASGLLGDLNISGLKRDASVKDSSQLLPGMGGVLDRLDSLTFAAPTLYWFTHWTTHI